MRENFIWFIAGLAIAIGGVAMGLSPPEFALARICFSIAAVIVLMRLFWWIFVEHQSDKKGKLFFMVGTFVVVGLLLWSGLQWINNREQLSTDVLLPGDDITPSLYIPPDRPSHVPDEAVTVSESEIIIFIGNFAVSTAESSFVVMKLYGKNLISISRIKNGISVSADIWDADGKILTTIENNKFRVNPNKTIPIIRPDPHTLIVEDERKARVLSVRFLNSKSIRIEGIFRAGGKYPVIIDEKTITFGPLLIAGGIALHRKGEAIFDWPGKLPDSKTYLAPDDNINIPTDATLRIVRKDNGAFNVVIRDSRGTDYSLMQTGGVNDGVTRWSALSVQLRNADTY